MNCSLIFSGYPLLATVLSLLLAATLVWRMMHAGDTMRRAVALSGIGGGFRIRRLAHDYAALMRQARSMIEHGSDASEILERAIGVVRTRRLFVMSLLFLAWAAGMALVVQFASGNSACLKTMASALTLQLDTTVAHAKPDAQDASPMVAGKQLTTLQRRSVTQQGFSGTAVGAEPRGQKLSTIPAKRTEVANGPA
ncbi:hypothetical protein JJB09_02705 [Rhizobium sp. KVB221]|uniref:Uncharacterized protein n=1 Tax=Rhizobium setariae TaxID=2801340 RepID=A0A937CN97_9HYPH|nr:hypothetical protein [Rhizobium setariae]MBL0370928.1 hypothetical protein [Rhizobium setariae]